MIGFLFIPLASPTLQPGENPYTILGVSRQASEQEIKQAFRKISMKYHPDVNKDPSAEKKWIKASDAYDILTDSNRRAAFDRTGSVSEQQEQSSNYGGYDPHEQFMHFFTGGRFRTSHIEFNTPEIDLSNLNTFLNQKNEVFVLFYGRNTFEAAQIFENCAKQLSEYTQFARCDTNTQNGVYFANQYQVNRVPTILYIRKTADGIDSRLSSFSSEAQLQKFIISSWNVKYSTFSSAKKAFTWVNAQSSKARVLIIQKKEADIEIINTIRKRSETAEFGLLTSDLVQACREFKLTIFPAVVTKRGNKYDITSPPIDSDDPKLTALLLGKLTQELLDTTTGTCYIKIGRPNSTDHSKFDDFLQSSAYVEANSQFARAVNVTEGKWVAISGNKYIVLNSLADVDKAHLRLKAKGAKILPKQLGLPTQAKPVMWYVEKAKNKVFGWLSSGDGSGSFGFMSIVVFLFFFLFLRNIIF